MPLNTISCGAPPISCFIALLTTSIYRYIYHKYPQVLAIGVINYVSYQTRAPPCMFLCISSKIYIFPLYVHYMSIMCPLYVHNMSIIYIYILYIYIYVHYVAIKPLQSPFSQHHCRHWDEATTTFTHTASPRLPRWLRRGLPWTAALHGGRRARGKQRWHQQTCSYCLRTMIE